MPIDKAFWESLGVPTDDILALEKELGNKIYRKLANKLAFRSEDFGPLIKRFYNVQGESLKELMLNLYSTSKENFIELYAVALFEDRKINPDIIYSIASKELKDDLAEASANQTINADALPACPVQNQSEHSEQDTL